MQLDVYTPFWQYESVYHLQGNRLAAGYWLPITLYMKVVGVKLSLLFRITST